MTKERQAEIDKMSMADFKALSPKERDEYMSIEIPLERRREIMTELHRRSLN